MPERQYRSTISVSIDGETNTMIQYIMENDNVGRSAAINKLIKLGYVYLTKILPEQEKGRVEK